MAPITHIEPLEGPNLKALGFDVLTLPPAKEALDRARDTGALALSGRLTLMQNATPGLVMYMPLYRADADNGTVEGRRQGLAGWVSAPFLMEDVIHGMSREFDADIGLQIIDSTPGAGAVSPVAMAGDAGAAAGVQLFTNLKAPALGSGGQPLQARRELELGGAALDLADGAPAWLCAALSGRWTPPGGAAGHGAEPDPGLVHPAAGHGARACRDPGT